MKFTTALRDEARRRIEQMENADIIVGVPCYNNNSTVQHVVSTISAGLNKYFRGMRSLLIISDGGSVDDTREMARETEIEPWVERVVSIYRGVPGKGSALRQVFEVADMLGAKACAVFDSDLRSIRPEWIRNLLRPITEEDYDFVAPYYKRYKYDGTITNNIVYKITRALYGKRVRQPIGGDFALSPDFIHFVREQDVWQTDVSRFGIDIWLTTTAIVHNFKIGQARLGVKIHDVKDPGEQLGPMFRQVVDTLMELTEMNVDHWIQVRGSEEVPILGDFHSEKPEPFDIDAEALVGKFKIGYQQFRSIWKSFLHEDHFEQLRGIAKLPAKKFHIPVELWARMLCDYAVAFHAWTANRYKLTTLMTPLYYGRIASWVNETRKMSDDEAEELIERDALKFEEAKDYLVERWWKMSDEIGKKAPKKINT